MKDFDMSAYLGVYLDEADEQIQILDTEILLLENEPTNMGIIQNIFRAAHTLKGSSASMGFEKMKELTHNLENVFDQIRNSELTVTSDLINVIFSTIDQIKVLKEAIVEGKLDEIDISSSIETLNNYKNGKAKPTEQKAIPSKSEDTLHVELDIYQKNIVRQGLTLGHSALEVTVKLHQEAMMKNVRALLIHNNLKEAGEVVASFPSIETLESEEDFNGEMTFIVLTMVVKREVFDIINQIPDIKHVNINEITEGNIDKKFVDDEVLEAPPTAISTQEQSTQANVPQKAKVNATVRVDVEKLEYLMNLVGELVIDQTRLVDVRTRLTEKDSRQEDDIEILDEITSHISRVTSELQEGMMKTRMLPIEQLFNRFPRMVRDTAMKANKEIKFNMHGKETELDRTLIEEISDPIIHLLRNAIDHGIETPEERELAGKPKVGKVELLAAHEENHIVIKISDDGKGIDPEKIKSIAIKKGTLSEEEAKEMTDKDAMFLIFKSGVSTAKKVTDISGRGVGMDIVKTHIEKLNGIIDIDSVIGEGTTFTIKLPLTLAIIRSLLVKFGEQTFAIPLVNVLEIIRLNKKDIQMIKDKEFGLVRGRVLPLVRMKEKLGIENCEEDHLKKKEFVIVVGMADKRIGIIADRTLGNQEIVIKSLGKYIGSPPYIAGATIMGDGSVALILEISSIVRDEGTQSQLNIEKQQQLEMTKDRQFVTFKLEDEEYGFDIEETKDIVSVPSMTKVVNAPKDVLGLINLRGTMLPVVDLRSRLNIKQKEVTKKSRIIVTEGKQQDIGFLVDEVTQVLKIQDDLIELPPVMNEKKNRKLIKGITKLDDRVITLINCNKLLYDEDFIDSTSTA
ncbi:MULTISPECIES: chemotaxis protein CheW [Lysinibacillus]|uniref:Chemotaxis protein CheA n=1 Tax=Lysinibacillus antri TaxID=2498145 RepID=A0A3S0RH37_9BACI|nr:MULTISPECIES: chemotaxis protein CheW [Lysinibacillus]RUL47896.1 chemotaxis protein CheA [Lysinibacillus antri]TSI10701.1 chemotaxis protein CheA [Lysinibacillus sp. BW-2-10]